MSFEAVTKLVLLKEWLRRYAICSLSPKRKEISAPRYSRGGKRKTLRPSLGKYWWCWADKKLETFSASTNRCSDFTKRQRLRSSLIPGEGGKASVHDFSKKLVSLQMDCSDFPIDCIFKKDEIGLFFRILLCRSYLLSREEKQPVGGVKDMKVKDKITGYSPSNAGRSATIPFSFNGKAKNLWCIRIFPQQLSFLARKMLGPTKIRLGSDMLRFFFVL